MTRLNFGRGLLRIWIALSVVWVAFVGWLAWDAVRIAAGGRWQYVVQMKTTLKPWERYDEKKPFLDQFDLPSKASRPPSFSKVEPQYVKGFDEFAAEGKIALIDFPDGSSIYLNNAFDKSEQELVSKWFWQQRWSRRSDALLGETWLLPLAIIPPLALLLFGLVVRWIVRGFRPA